MTATAFGLLRVADADTGAVVREVRASDKALWRLAVSADGRWAATAGNDGGISVWDAGTWERRRTVAVPGDHLWTVAFAPDGSAVLAAGDAGRVYEWAVPR